MYKIVRTPSVECHLIDFPCDLCGTWVPKVQIVKTRWLPSFELCERCLFQQTLRN